MNDGNSFSYFASWKNSRPATALQEAVSNFLG